MDKWCKCGRKARKREIDTWNNKVYCECSCGNKWSYDLKRRGVMDKEYNEVSFKLYLDQEINMWRVEIKFPKVDYFNIEETFKTKEMAIKWSEQYIDIITKSRTYQKKLFKYELKRLGELLYEPVEPILEKIIGWLN